MIAKLRASIKRVFGVGERRPMLSIAEMPRARQIESRRATMAAGDTVVRLQVPVQPVDSEASVYAAPNDILQLQEFLETTSDDDVRMVTLDTLIVFDGAPPILLAGDPYCVACGRRIRYYGNAISIGQYKTGGETPAEVVCIHHTCVETVVTELDTFVEEHTDVLLGEVL